MIRQPLPAQLREDLAAAVRREEQARAAFRQARSALRAAVLDTADAVAAFREFKVPLTRVAIIVARELGVPPSVGARHRLAARLRQRLARSRDPLSRPSA